MSPAGGSERVLTLRELNRATLARQLLLERQKMPVVRAVERVAGLQAQWPPAPFVGLWSRIEGFRYPALERALVERRVVKATLMRATLHLVSRRDYPTFLSAVHGGDAPLLRPDAVAYGERVTPAVRAFLANGPRSRTEVFEFLEESHGLDPHHPTPWGLWFAIRTRAHVVHAPESALWNAGSRMRFVALEEMALPDAGSARVELVRRYLAAFGPATRADVADWSGLRVRDFADAVEALEPLRRFRNEDGKELLDLPRAPLPAGDVSAPARFLPKWDSLLLGHKDRRRVMTDEIRKAVIATNGDVAQTFLVDGVVAGTWSLRGDRIRLEPFGPVPQRAARELREEAARLEAFVR
ncbi:MAG: winged helix DNA-binding domain-containing protein [Actinomycetota bacterium]